MATQSELNAEAVHLRKAANAAPLAAATHDRATIGNTFAEL